MTNATELETVKKALEMYADGELHGNMPAVTALEALNKYIEGLKFAEVWFNDDGEFGMYRGWLIKKNDVSRPLDKEETYRVVEAQAINIIRKG